jgi:hypothetical protein
MKDLNELYGDWNEDVEIGQKSIISGHFLRIFYIFKGGKVTPYHKNKKTYLLKILYTH